MKNKNKRIFVEVLWDYTEEGTGNIAIDGYPDRKPDGEGRTVAWVTPDGNVIKGEHANEGDIDCKLVQETIQLAKNEQEERKQKLVDAVIEDLKDSFKHGDYTVLDELLKFIPTKNLIQALPEEQWTNYPIEIK